MSLTKKRRYELAIQEINFRTHKNKTRPDSLSLSYPRCRAELINGSSVGRRNRIKRYKKKRKYRTLRWETIFALEWDFWRYCVASRMWYAIDREKEFCRIIEEDKPTPQAVQVLISHWGRFLNPKIIRSVKAALNLIG